MNKNNCHYSDLVIIAILFMVYFPIFYLTSIVLDSTSGISEFVIRFQYDSRGELFSEFLKGWKDSIPVLLLDAVIIFMPLYCMLRKKSINLGASLILAGGINLAITAFLMRGEVMLMSIISFSGIILLLVCSLSISMKERIFYSK